MFCVKRDTFSLCFSGQKFAMLELKVTVAKVLRHFELLPAVPEHKPILLAQAILNSANGVCIQLKERK